MKTRISLFLILTITILTGCDLNTVSNYKPEILFVQNPIVSHGDTLNILYTDQAGVYKLDTIEVGDTVNFRIFINAYSNKINSFNITQSADSVTKVILPSRSSLDSVFLSSSNYEQGKFYFKIPANTLYFPFRYIALKPSKQAFLTLSVISNATTEFAQTTIQLNTVITQNK